MRSLGVNAALIGLIFLIVVRKVMELLWDEVRLGFEPA
jgi:hypothetical protein